MDNIVEKIFSDIKAQEEARRKSRDQMIKYLSEDPTKKLDEDDMCNGDGWDQEYKVVGISLRDTTRLSPDVLRIHQTCSNANMYYPEIYSGQTIFFKIKYHSSGKWAAMPILPRMNSLCWNDKIYYGEDRYNDLMIILPDAIASWCGVEPSEDIRSAFMPLYCC